MFYRLEAFWNASIFVMRDASIFDSLLFFNKRFISCWILCVWKETVVPARKQDWHQKKFYMATLSLQKIAKMRTVKTQTRTLIDVILPRGSITREETTKASKWVHKSLLRQKINQLPTTSNRIKDTPHKHFSKMKILFSITTLLLLFVARTVTAADYGLDCSWPIHNDKIQCDLFGSERQATYDHYMEGCREKWGAKGAKRCDSNEQDRLEMSRRQPQSMVNYTSTGFQKLRYVVFWKWFLSLSFIVFIFGSQHYLL
jgi:hypothetical protein